MATTEQLQAQLTEAEAALHKLLMGSKEETVQSADGRRVTYTAVKISDLRAHIADLKRQLGQSSGRYRAVGVSF